MGVIIIYLLFLPGFIGNCHISRLKNSLKLSLVAQAYNPRTGNTNVGGSLVQGQPRQHREISSPNDDNDDDDDILKAYKKNLKNMGYS